MEVHGVEQNVKEEHREVDRWMDDKVQVRQGRVSNKDEVKKRVQIRSLLLLKLIYLSPRLFCRSKE